MSKPKRLMEPFEVTRADLENAGKLHAELQKYAEAVLALLPGDAKTVVGSVEVRRSNDLPILVFTPKKVNLAELVKVKL